MNFIFDANMTLSYGAAIVHMYVDSVSVTVSVSDRSDKYNYKQYNFVFVISLAQC